MTKNWEHAAGILCPTLTDAAQRREHLTYGRLAPLVQTNPLNVGRALGPIQSHCMDYRLPPLTAIVIGQSSKRPGGGFIAWDVDDIGSAYEAVFGFDWRSADNPFGGFGPSETTDSLAEILATDPSKSTEVYAKVRVRGPAQRIFRATLLRAYEGACAVCGLTFEDALEAAHIIPWSKSSRSERLSPNNGILMCSNHHRLYDTGWLSIGADWRIMLDDDDLSDYSEADVWTLASHIGRKLRVPQDRRLRPSRKLLRRRIDDEGAH